MKLKFNGLLEKKSSGCNCKRQSNGYGFVNSRMYILPSGQNKTFYVGKVEEVLALNADIRGKDVIIIEDIIDSGLTMHAFKQRLEREQPASIALAALLFKPEQLLYEDARPDYYGAEITKEFVIGYGLDLDGLARNLPEIYKATK